MPASPGEFQSARAILGFSRVVPRRHELDDAFTQAVAAQFPIVASHQLVPAEAPLQLPHLVLQSTASRVAISAVGAEFETRFYGDFVRDYPQCRSYVRDKLVALLSAFRVTFAVDVSFLGIVLTETFSYTASERPPIHLLRHHLRDGLAPEATVQDVLLRVIVREADKYFISVSLSNYETKILERPVFAGQAVQVKPWEGEVSDRGITVEVDVNNRLDAMMTRNDPTVDVEELDRILTVVSDTVTWSPNYIDGAPIPTSRPERREG